MWMEWIKLTFRQRLGAHSKLDWNIVQAAGREATIEVPQPGNDDANDRHANVGTRLIKHHEIQAFALRKLHTRDHLLARAEARELFIALPLGRRSFRGHQEGMIL